ncbi:hypothetical protein SEVIR_8G098800v4 [Setaria viridis]|uniref:Dirigent protein n=1 Tax=Setaria viridis TaxID=4556 RepID=A0A4U6THE8_SETVI|nr:dirigent protein 19-like [Setaria viridis]TKW00285.1 hypothetical protein SEVIR_8G098800v2 [Setaria viridis]
MASVMRHVQHLMAVAAIAAVATHGATTTHLQFYMHDTVTPSAGSPATAVRVVRGPTPAPGDPINRFGDLYVIDDPLTEGPDLASRAVGRAQGFYLMASRSVDQLLLSANMAFTAGKYNGSSITLLGRDAIFDEIRELPVVGGTGGFHGAAGYGLIRTHSLNASNNNAVLVIDMYLML